MCCADSSGIMVLLGVKTARGHHTVVDAEVVTVPHNVTKLARTKLM
jgi:hypothetical protein